MGDLPESNGKLDKLDDEQIAKILHAQIYKERATKICPILHLSANIQGDPPQLMLVTDQLLIAELLMQAGLEANQHNAKISNPGNKEETIRSRQIYEFQISQVSNVLNRLGITYRDAVTDQPLVHHYSTAEGTSIQES